MRIVLLCGSNPNHVALANKIAARFELVGIVAEERKRYWKRSFLQLAFQKMNDKLFFSEIAAAWSGLMAFYKQKYPAFPSVEVRHTDDINSEDVVSFLQKKQPDLVMVSGTGLLRKKILELEFPRGMINLHTGLSPYVKGGPNCTNWCLALGSFHLIGNTVMWINEGIDSGNILLSDTVSFTGEETLKEIHMKVMEHAHTLYLDAVEKIAAGGNMPSVPQHQVAQGKTYYSREWTFERKRQLLKNMRSGLFKTTVNSPAYRAMKSALKIFNH